MIKDQKFREIIFHSQAKNKKDKKESKSKFVFFFFFCTKNAAFMETLEHFHIFSFRSLHYKVPNVSQTPM